MAEYFAAPLEQHQAPIYAGAEAVVERSWGLYMGKTEDHPQIPARGYHRSRMLDLTALYEGATDPAVVALLTAMPDAIALLLVAAPLLKEHVSAVRLKVVEDREEPGVLDIYASTALRGEALVSAKERFYDALPSLHPRIYFLDCEP